MVACMLSCRVMTPNNSHKTDRLGRRTRKPMLLLRLSELFLLRLAERTLAGLLLIFAILGEHPSGALSVQLCSRQNCPRTATDHAPTGLGRFPTLKDNIGKQALTQALGLRMSSMATPALHPGIDIIPIDTILSILALHQT